MWVFFKLLLGCYVYYNSYVMVTVDVLVFFLKIGGMNQKRELNAINLIYIYLKYLLCAGTNNV